MKIIECYLVEWRLGRIVLHSVAIIRDGKLQWHWKGIWREITLH